ncbi:DNA replication/repair protein RecF [Moorella sp. Hama-1]|uniref:DNA replication/repair protein RecF n=1 Tax=Moorella sp. Hama-1 TaxID=2138101 RepID=UPI000D643F68|nr:DNA replication/repair protein RecF [Moorella sp. Hama-1]MDN5361581.1 replication and repair protein RecF [Moorella sp. (in: firmicutes)]BCV19935.1 DNA replication and repair protein RecF [Moorella sp. Hama-1]
MSALRLLQLQLVNFRSYSHLTWDCHSGLNIICGPNAAGKTNLLEAIGYLAVARSFRQQLDQQLLAWGATSFQIKGLCLSYDDEVEIFISYQQHNKGLTINGIRSRLMELLGVFPGIYFGPDDLNLIKGGPSQRRQFLDREISMGDRLYCRSLQEYRRILLQRNLLLRALKAGRGKAAELEPWDIQLLQAGQRIMAKREGFLQALEPLAADLFQKMAGGEKLALTYRPGVGDRQEWEDRLQSGREREIQAGMTLFGPHRDDFSVTFSGHEARYFASQGQQRTMVLALKLAEARYYREMLGVMPVLLLDDVFSELDDQRQQALLELLAVADQAFLTTTEISLLPERLIKQASIWALSRGGEPRLISGPDGK